MCDQVMDSYKDILYDRYKDKPEKLDETVSNSPIFTKTKKEFTKTWWYKLFNNPKHFEQN